VLHNIVKVNVLILPKVTQAIEKVLPNLLSLVPAKPFVAEGQLDSRLEGFIEASHPVSGENEDPLVVLECAKEDRDKGVALQVLESALLEEDFGFVKEDNAVPDFAEVEDRGEVFLNIFRFGANIAASYRVERFLGNFGNRLSRKGLARTGRATVANVSLFPPSNSWGEPLQLILTEGA
jgi:hypothetical protein